MLPLQHRPRFLLLVIQSKSTNVKPRVYAGKSGRRSHPYHFYAHLSASPTRPSSYTGTVFFANSAHKTREGEQPYGYHQKMRSSALSDISLFRSQVRILLDSLYPKAFPQ